jgi:hypothetical protein
MSEVIATGMTVTDSKKATDRILAKIRALLAKADGTDNEHEAAAFREHAEKLMREYRVAEEHLIAANPDSVKPVVTEADLFMYGATPFGQQYINMMHAVARHTGIRDHYIYLARKADGRTVLRAFLVGYEADTRYADALFTSAQMVFQARLEPSVDPKADDRENVYRLRSAGIERNRIARMLWNLDTHASHAKVGQLYKEACALRGEDPKVSGRNINAKNYRELYAEEFVNELGRRLRRAQDGADSAGGTLVLAGRSERVDEAFYDRFPELRPSTTLVKSEPCEKCTKTKHASGKCQAHRPRAYTKADDDRWERRHNSATAIQARSAGRQAAAEVELRGATPAKRLGD